MIYTWNGCHSNICHGRMTFCWGMSFFWGSSTCTWSKTFVLHLQIPDVNFVNPVWFDLFWVHKPSSLHCSQRQSLLTFGGMAFLWWAEKYSASVSSRSHQVCKIVDADEWFSCYHVIWSFLSKRSFLKLQAPCMASITLGLSDVTLFWPKLKVLFVCRLWAAWRALDWTSNSDLRAPDRRQTPHQTSSSR